MATDVFVWVSVVGECYLVSGEEGEIFGNRATSIL